MPAEALRNRKREQDINANETVIDKTDLYTPEQKAAVDSIGKCKDFYEILGVNKDVEESDLRKQYKKMALQFHPDKNKVPGAVEAFKAIGNAFSVLSDPEKKRKYDIHGHEAFTDSFVAQNGSRYYTFEGDMSPEELYNIFFQEHVFVRRGSRWQRYYTRASQMHHEENTRSTLLQILPLVIIVCLSLLSTFFVSDPPYSLQKTPKYLHEQRTANLDVPYYVKENFLHEYDGRIPNIEKTVEEEYLITVRTSCFRERNYKENMIFRAKHFKDLTLEAKARDLRTPSCDILNDLYNALYSE